MPVCTALAMGAKPSPSATSSGIVGNSPATRAAAEIPAPRESHSPSACPAARADGSARAVHVRVRPPTARPATARTKVRRCAGQRAAQSKSRAFPGSAAPRAALPPSAVRPKSTGTALIAYSPLEKVAVTKSYRHILELRKVLRRGHAALPSQWGGAAAASGGHQPPSTKLTKRAELQELHLRSRSPTSDASWHACPRCSSRSAIGTPFRPSFLRLIAIQSANACMNFCQELAGRVVGQLAARVEQLSPCPM